MDFPGKNQTTIKDLKKALEGVPEDWIVVLETVPQTVEERYPNLVGLPKHSGDLMRAKPFCGYVWLTNYLENNDNKTQKSFHVFKRDRLISQYANSDNPFLRRLGIKAGDKVHTYFVVLTFLNAVLLLVAFKVELFTALISLLISHVVADTLSTKVSIGERETSAIAAGKMPRELI